MKKYIYSNIKDTDALESFLNASLTAILIARVLLSPQHATQNI
tara:strand:+ start:385 stop:513 length:129 start_codon:yes stop_codon:yes gene_type:complete